MAATRAPRLRHARADSRSTIRCCSFPAMAAVTRASRLRRHRQSVLRAALSVRPPHVDARSSDRRPDRLEHRHRLSRQRRARRWERAADARTTNATTSPRNYMAARLQALGGQLGRRRGAVATANGGVSPTRERVRRVASRGAAFRRRRDPSHANPRRNARRVTRIRPAPRRGPRIRRPTRRMRVRVRSLQAHRAARRRICAARADLSATPTISGLLARPRSSPRDRRGGEGQI